jgi:hypothetical protein
MTDKKLLLFNSYNDILFMDNNMTPMSSSLLFDTYTADDYNNDKWKCRKLLYKTRSDDL